jgi:hypothetical protein
LSHASASAHAAALALAAVIEIFTFAAGLFRLVSALTALAHSAAYRPFSVRAGAISSRHFNILPVAVQLELNHYPTQWILSLRPK